MQSNELANEQIINLSKQCVPQAWLGTNPPFEKDIIDAVNSTDFRVSPNFHRKYKIVWLYENGIECFGAEAREILLDEALRLIDGEGKIVVRMEENGDSVFSWLKNHLDKKFDFECGIFFEHEYLENGAFVAVFDVKRKNIEKYSGKNWTFAVLGEDEKKVEETVSSIKKAERKSFGEEKIQVLVLKSGEKSEILESAKCENLALLDNGKTVEEDFFFAFEKFGYDFSVLDTEPGIFICKTHVFRNFNGDEAAVKKAVVWRTNFFSKAAAIGKERGKNFFTTDCTPWGYRPQGFPNEKEAELFTNYGWKNFIYPDSLAEKERREYFSGKRKFARKISGILSPSFKNGKLYKKIRKIILRRGRAK